MVVGILDQDQAVILEDLVSVGQVKYPCNNTVNGFAQKDSIEPEVLFLRLVFWFLIDGSQ